jgi:ACR3 family arsenite efflux pump ArsB
MPPAHNVLFEVLWEIFITDELLFLLLPLLLGYSIQESSLRPEKRLVKFVMVA